MILNINGCRKIFRRYFMCFALAKGNQNLLFCEIKIDVSITKINNIIIDKIIKNSGIHGSSLTLFL